MSRSGRPVWQIGNERVILGKRGITVNGQDAIRPLVAGNWKMNGLGASVAEAAWLLDLMGDAGGAGCDVMLCPPATLLPVLAGTVAGSPILLGGQDCHVETVGAHTGDISAEMLADGGCVAVIVGHSERRADHGESNELVCAKAAAAHRARLVAIICIGETGAERDGGATLDILAAQLAASVPDGATADNTVVAYEPVWAIGSGRTPALAEVADAHGFIRATLRTRFGESGRRMRLLYGGSVTAANAAELMAVEHVDGALVGGASLKAADFWGIIATYS